MTNGKVVKGITRNWLYTNFYLLDTKFYRSLIYGESVKHFKVPVGKSRPGSANDPNIKLPTHGPNLKFPQGDDNICIVCSLALSLYEFIDIYASNYVYQRLNDVGSLKAINRMVNLCDLMSGHRSVQVTPLINKWSFYILI